MLLLMLGDTEQTFWLLETTIRRLPGYYQADMHGLKVDAKVLTVLLR